MRDTRSQKTVQRPDPSLSSSILSLLPVFPIFVYPFSFIFPLLSTSQPPSVSPCSAYRAAPSSSRPVFAFHLMFKHHSRRGTSVPAPCQPRETCQSAVRSLLVPTRLIFLLISSSYCVCLLSLDTLENNRRAGNSLGTQSTPIFFGFHACALLAMEVMAISGLISVDYRCNLLRSLGTPFSLRSLESIHAVLFTELE